MKFLNAFCSIFSSKGVRIHSINNSNNTSAIIKSVFWLFIDSFPSSLRWAEAGSSGTGMTTNKQLAQRRKGNNMFQLWIASVIRGSTTTMNKEKTGSNPRSNILSPYIEGNNCKWKGRKTQFRVARIWNLNPSHLHPWRTSTELMIFLGKITFQPVFPTCLSLVPEILPWTWESFSDRLFF